ncbi:hypothetical protein [Paenibacillus sambharensis]|nr:hypothetical protein [Paenibacillus sambharensis]
MTGQGAAGRQVAEKDRSSLKGQINRVIRGQADHSRFLRRQAEITYSCS